MKIINNDGISKSEHSHLLLDSSLLVENQICEAISLVTSVRESETRTGNPYVSFTLLDKHSGVIEASMFGINKKEYNTKLMKSFSDCIVYIKGEVVIVRGDLRINLISIDEWTESVFTSKDFIPVIKDINEEKASFDNILKYIGNYHEDLRPVVASIIKLNLRDIMGGTYYVNKPGVQVGDLLKLSNKVSSSLLNIEEEGTLINSASALLTILHLGLKHYIKMDADKKGNLIKNNITNQLKLVSTLITNHNIFGNTGISGALSTEYSHLDETMLGLVEPCTLISKTVPKLIEANWSLIYYNRLNEMSVMDNEYLYGGEKFIKIL